MAKCSDGTWCVFSIRGGDVELGQTLEAKDFNGSFGSDRANVLNMSTNQPVHIYLEDWQNSVNNSMAFLAKLGRPTTLTMIESDGRTTTQRI
ncbi:MAG: hypothetical protein H0X66_09555 [Verrucomicrobia bacterium]|nr:hypothetical protein [Verrucomicrobiota bacterium]